LERAGLDFFSFLGLSGSRFTTYLLLDFETLPTSRFGDSMVYHALSVLSNIWSLFFAGVKSGRGT
jgi:hypothetical protein